MKPLALPFETWYPVGIPGFQDYYEASDFGQVRNSITKKILSIRKSKKGYSRACLMRNGKRWEGHKAIVIARTFPEICGEWFDGAEVDHINGCRVDDRPCNLKVVTHKANCRNPRTLCRYRQRDLPQFKELAERSKLQTIVDGVIFSSQREASKFIGISEVTLSAIKRGRLENRTGHNIQFETCVI